MRCVTNAAYGFRRFSDSECKNAIALTYSATSIPKITLVTQACQTTNSVYATTGVATVTASPFLLNGSGHCVSAVSADGDYPQNTYVTFGAEVPAATFAEIPVD